MSCVNRPVLARELCVPRRVRPGSSILGLASRREGARVADRGRFERIYHVVRMIPAGQVATYGQIAAIVDDPRGARTVGWALSVLREGTDVPWHRVINARGKISLPGMGGEQPLQRQLLERESVVFGAGGVVDLRIYQWEGLDWPEIEALHREWNA
ncbi:MAG: MGMT family protein [Anaerolineae bacterium]|nr:MGMT family protein [Anaerolineae bacterium]